jgi:hypothetical protein
MRRLRFTLAFVTVLFLLFIGFAIYSWNPDSASPTHRILVEDAGQTTSTVKGVVYVSTTLGGQVRWHLDGPGGMRTLATTNSFDWDTRDLTNGAYRLSVVGDRSLSLEVAVQNPRLDAGTTAAVVGTTTAVAVGASTITSSVASRVTVATVQVAKSSLLALGEEHLAARTSAKRHRVSSLWALAITLAMIFLFFAFEGLARLAWRDYLGALPVIGGVSVIFVALAFGAEALLARAGRAKSKVRLLLSGGVSLIVSSIAFRTPFGYPGYVEEQDDLDKDGTDDIAAGVEALRAMASLLVLLGLLIPFLLVGRWVPAVADQAMEMAIVTIATGALPLSPMPGHDIWRWRKSVAIAFVLGAYTLYFGYQLAFNPPGLISVLGWTGLALYAFTAAWLRGSSSAEPALWVRAVRQFRATMAQSAAIGAPRFMHAAVVRMQHQLRGLAARTQIVVRAARDRLARFARPLIDALVRRRQRELDAAHLGQEDAFIAEASALVFGLDELEDDVELAMMEPDRCIRIGDLRDDILHLLLLRARRNS